MSDLVRQIFLSLFRARLDRNSGDICNDGGHGSHGQHHSAPQADLHLVSLASLQFLNRHPQQSVRYRIESSGVVAAD